jgi:hypothetical protein
VRTAHRSSPPSPPRHCRWTRRARREALDRHRSQAGSAHRRGRVSGPPPHGVLVRKPPSIELSLQPLPTTLVRERAECPYCCLTGDRAATAIGRIGLRLVFRCTSCQTRFFRAHLPVLSNHGDDLWDPSVADEPDLLADAT